MLPARLSVCHATEKTTLSYHSLATSGCLVAWIVGFAKDRPPISPNGDRRSVVWTVLFHMLKKRPLPSPLSLLSVWCHISEFLHYQKWRLKTIKFKFRSFSAVALHLLCQCIFYMAYHILSGNNFSKHRNFMVNVCRYHLGFHPSNYSQKSSIFYVTMYTSVVPNTAVCKYSCIFC